MLINNSVAVEPDYISMMVAQISGRSAHAVSLAEGVYQIGHFGGTSCMKGYNHYPDLTREGGEYFGAYGVCDDYTQILEQCPDLQHPDRQFTITITEIRKDSEPSEGGWRWHKWGGYIGTKNPQHEYLYEETDIDVVYTYHVYEKVV